MDVRVGGNLGKFPVAGSSSGILYALWCAAFLLQQRWISGLKVKGAVVRRHAMLQDHTVTSLQPSNQDSPTASQRIYIPIFHTGDVVGVLYYTERGGGDYPSHLKPKPKAQAAWAEQLHKENRSDCIEQTHIFFCLKL